MPEFRLLLGSMSPRRHRIVAALGIPFEVAEPAVFEMHDDRDAVRTAATNALAKHAWCRARHPGCWILTADTVVEFEGTCLGKPRDPEQAAAFLRSYSGKAQQVFTAVALSAPGEPPDLRVAASSLRFRTLTEEAIRAYLDLAAPYDRAGAYDVDAHGARIVAGTCGSYTNIMGLPAETVADWFRARGCPVNPVFPETLPGAGPGIRGGA